MACLAGPLALRPCGGVTNAAVPARARSPVRHALLVCMPAPPPSPRVRCRKAFVTYLLTALGRYRPRRSENRRNRDPISLAIVHGMEK